MNCRRTNRRATEEYGNDCSDVMRAKDPYSSQVPLVRIKPAEHYMHSLLAHSKQDSQHMLLLSLKLLSFVVFPSAVVFVLFVLVFPVVFVVVLVVFSGVDEV
jgi:uncharacterized membrane protein YagU involved in acid resistance